MLTFRPMLDKFAPAISKTVVFRPSVPWFNDDIRGAKRARRSAERKWRSSNALCDLIEYRVKRNNLNFVMKQARTNYYQNRFEENGSDQRKPFRAP